MSYYLRYRPGYPPGVLEHLRRVLGLSPAHVVADVGSGTGTVSEMLLRNGNVVYAVEPNAPMREAAEAALSRYPGFHSRTGSAEATGLGDRSVDFIVAAQAFHWFRPAEARREFRRIGRPGAWTVLVWNRRLECSPFLRAYERLLRRLARDYARVDHRQRATPAALSPFFGPGGYRRTSFANRQVLDRDGLRGRALSSSYVPLPGQPGHDAVLGELRGLFDAHRRDGRVAIEYETEVFWGRLDPGQALH